jgi:hypothetical protein
MGVAGILVAASLLVPEDVATENDITVADVWDNLAHDEWEVALDLLQEPDRRPREQHGHELRGGRGPCHRRSSS